MDYLMWVVISYLIVINIIAFIVFGVDKSRARRHAWRVPEATLFALAIFGGSIGAIAEKLYGVEGERRVTGSQSIGRREGGDSL